MSVYHIGTHLLDDKDYAIVAKVRFRLPERAKYSDYELGFSPAGRAARKVFQGPLTEDLFGWMNECAAAIGLHAISVGRPLIELHDGDEIVVEGHGTFVVQSLTFSRPRREVQLEVLR